MELYNLTQVHYMVKYIMDINGVRLNMKIDSEIKNIVLRSDSLNLTPQFN